MNVEQLMRIALEEAKLAREAGEIPVGALIVRGGEIVARAHNQKERLHDPTAHAEIIAIRAAASKLGDWRLTGCTLYVTLEPCCMCASALVAARVDRIVFGTSDPEYGGCGGAFELCSGELGHAISVVGGVLEADCSAMLKTHFMRARSK